MGGHPQRKPKTAPTSEMNLRSYFFFYFFLLRKCISENTTFLVFSEMHLRTQKNSKSVHIFGSSFPKLLLHIQISLLHYFIIFLQNFSKPSLKPNQSPSIFCPKIKFQTVDHVKGSIESYNFRSTSLISSPISLH